MKERHSVLERLKAPVPNEKDAPRFFNSDECEFFPFTDKPHLKNHLNYLIHSDAQDKYTNEASAGNKTFLYFDPEVVVYGWIPSFEERKKLSAQLYKTLAKSFDSIYFARIECENERIFHWNEAMEQEMLSLLDEIRKEGFEPLVVQIHDDQPKLWCHFHVIARKKQK